MQFLDMQYCLVIESIRCAYMVLCSVTSKSSEWRTPDGDYSSVKFNAVYLYTYLLPFLYDF